MLRFSGISGVICSQLFLFLALTAGCGCGWGVGTGKGNGKENVVPVCSLARKKAGRPAGLLHHRERALVSSRRLRLPQT